jgi:hypothetical protein
MPPSGLASAFIYHSFPKKLDDKEDSLSKNNNTKKNKRSPDLSDALWLQNI